MQGLIVENKANLYKIKLDKGSNVIAFSNCIYYDNQNKTLPVGMDLSTKMIIDTSKLHLRMLDQKSFNIMSFDNEQDDFSDFEIKKVTVFDYEIVDLADLEQEDNEN